MLLIFNNRCYNEQVNPRKLISIYTQLKERLYVLGNQNYWMLSSIYYKLNKLSKFHIYVLLFIKYYKYMYIIIILCMVYYINCFKYYIVVYYM